MAFRHIYKVLQGESHIAEGIPCQDAIEYYERKGRAAIVLSDGAGSIVHSEIVSSAVAEWTSVYMAEEFDNIYNILINDKKYLIHCLAINIQRMLHELEIQYNDCCCTLAAVAISEDGRWFSIHVGDGIIFSNSTEISVVSIPENGIFANETYFVNDDEIEKHLHIEYGYEREKITFLLSSDGLGNLLYGSENGNIANAVGRMMEWIDTYDNDKAQEVLEYNMSEVFADKSTDDLSIGILQLRI